MRQDWEPEDLIEVWTLLEDDMKRLRNKSGANRLGFALLLKFFEVDARFPESVSDVPAAAVAYVAQQVKVPAQEWSSYDWHGKAIQRHRGEIRAAFGFRAGTEEDQEKLAEWLAAELCSVELSRDRLAEAVVARCRNDRLEPPAPGQVVENWNSANQDLFYGKDGDLTGADKESQEVSMLALHPLQSVLVHVNTLLMQQVLADPKWADKLTDADRRGLSPLFWTHVNPYGRFELDMNSRLDLGRATPIPGQWTEEPQPAAAG
ncbi:DUF4158 domain-containing protein [Streptosporangium canum]|uniref:DUF4158 domain-containing protein n=1 Tax=Streptosporangium canum TaxID=324952 RepID=UPI0033B359E9